MEYIQTKHNYLIHEQVLKLGEDLALEDRYLVYEEYPKYDNQGQVIAPGRKRYRFTQEELPANQQHVFINLYDRDWEIKGKQRITLTTDLDKDSDFMWPEYFEWDMDFDWDMDFEWDIDFKWDNDLFT